MNSVFSFLSLNGAGRLAYYLVHLISILGVFSLLSRCVNLHSPILLLPSLYIGPLIIFIFSGLFGLPLFPVTVVVFLISLTGFFFIKPLLQEKDSKPALYLFLLWSFILSLYGRTPYLPTQWDEFSHWLTYPVQLSQFGTLVSENFYNVLTLSYPPLYPITLAYPTILLGVDPLKVNYMIVPLLSWIALFAGLYPYLKKAFFGLTLPLIFSLLFLKGLPTDVLIEWPQLHLLSLFFILAAGGITNSQRTQVILLSLLGVLLIFLKNSNFIILLPLILFLGRDKRWKSALGVSLTILAVTLPALALWKSKTSFVDYPFQPGGLTHLPMNEFFSQSGAIFGKMLKKLFNFLGYFEVFVSLIVIYLYRKKISLMNTFKNPVVLTLVFYFIMMFVMYVFFFQPYEAKIIASFERYYSVLLLPLCFTLVFINRRKLADLLRPMRKNYLVILLILVGLFRFIEPQIRIRGEAHKFKALWRQVAPHIPSDNSRGLFVSQGDDGSDLVQTRYSSLMSYPKLISWAGRFSFSQNPQNHWAVKIDENFHQSLSKYDFILVYKGDDEIYSQLAKLSGIQYNACINVSRNNPLLLVQGQKGWECHKLH